MAKVRIEFKEAPDNSRWPESIKVTKESPLVWLLETPQPPSALASGYINIYTVPENVGYTSILLNSQFIRYIETLEV